MGQTQDLTLGSSTKYTKGDINTDVLIGIIDKKQDELKKRILHDLVVKAFNSTKVSEKSFTIYQYLYNLIDIVINEKNKGSATKLIIQDMMQFGIIHEFQKKFMKEYVIIGLGNGSVRSKLLSALSSEYTRITSTPTGQSGQQYDLGDEGANKLTHLLLDTIYDLLLETGAGSLWDNINTALGEAGKNLTILFLEPARDKALQTWYENDNLYKRSLMAGFKDFGGFTAKDIQDFRSDLKNFLLAKVADIVNPLLPTGKLLKQLLGTGRKLETISQDQVLALYDILDEIADEFQYVSANFSLLSSFTKFARKHFEFNSTILQDGKSVVKDISINIETLILELNSLYNNPNRKVHSIPTWRWGNFIKPRIFLKMGLNTGRFIQENTLAKDDAGNNVKLYDVYYASEKIGFQFNFLDQGYTHSFKQGEPFRYRGEFTKWKRPQPDPLLYRIHLEFYASGLLYNLANLKTSKDFNYLVLGTNFGFTFFNGLSASAGIATPINVYSSQKNVFLNLSLDIPIIEYLAGLKK
jgi:hypothetical protein